MDVNVNFKEGCYRIDTPHEAREFDNYLQAKLYIESLRPIEVDGIRLEIMERLWRIEELFYE
jgi:hypothetical protein